jgi:hypothetical protein
MQNIYLKKIYETKILNEPFDHLVIDNFLEKNLFNKICNNLDKIYSLKSFTKSFSRVGLHIKDWADYDVLKEVKDEIFNDEIKKNLIDKFSYQINKKKPKSLDSKWVAHFTFDNSLYKISKHRDNHMKQLTFILYIKGGVSGTVLHKNFFSSKKDKIIEFRENRLLCFSSFLNTWHSVKVPSKAQDRYTIQAWLEFLKEPELQWTSNGYPELFNIVFNKLKNIFRKKNNCKN